MAKEKKKDFWSANARADSAQLRTTDSRYVVVVGKKSQEGGDHTAGDCRGPRVIAIVTWCTTATREGPVAPTFFSTSPTTTTATTTTFNSFHFTEKEKKRPLPPSYTFSLGSASLYFSLYLLPVSAAGHFKIGKVTGKDIFVRFFCTYRDLWLLENGVHN